MNTKQIEYILAIAEEKNISRAAERLFVSQSALSQSLINLEKEIGAPLFVRDQREMKLTEAGRYYVDACREIMRIKEQTYQTIRELNRISYKIGISSTEGMHRFLAAMSPFQEKHPGVEIFASDGESQSLLKDLQRGLYLAVIIAIDAEEKIDFPYEILSTEEVFLVMPEKLAAGRSGGAECRDLGNEKFILSTPNTTMRRITDRIFLRSGFTPNVISETNNTTALLQMVSAGRGIGFLPGNLCREMPGVVFVPMQPEVFRHQAIVYRSDNINDYLLDFINLLKETGGMQENM